jgi:hypothetical protein
MVTQKITFKVTEIISDSFGVRIRIEEVDFPTSKGDEKTKIMDIILVGKRGGEIKDTFEKGKSYEMDFEDSEIEDDRTPKVKKMEMHSAGMAGGPDSEPPNKLFLQPDKRLRIVYNKSGDTIKFQEKANEQPKKNPPKNPNPKPDKDPNQPPSPNPDSDNPNKNPNDPTPKKQPDEPDKSPDKEDTPEPQKAPPKSSEPTSEEVNNAKNKLKQARESDNKDDLVSALNETEATTKNSSDQTLKKEKELTENKLGQLDKEELKKIIREEVANELQKFGIKAGDLSQQSKQKLDELNNNNNNNNNINPDEAKNIRSEILNEAGTKALDRLITQVEQVIKSGDAKQIETNAKELREFTEDTSDEYVQSAYLQKKDRVRELLEKAKNRSNQNNEEGFLRLNNPLM